jgi:hypothetical protein
MKIAVITFLTCAALYLEGSPITVRLPSLITNAMEAESPFTVRTDEPSSLRFQQGFSGAEISVYGHSAPAWLITKIALRGASSDPNLVSRHVEIDFSTTHQIPSSLSPVFAENIGPDVTRVFSGSITWVTTSPPDPLDRQYEIVLDAPFLYVPEGGNLLMEIRNYETFTFTELPLPITSRYSAGPGTGHLWAPSAEAAFAPWSSAWSLSFFFTMTPIPEPSTWALLLSGMALAGLWRWRTRTAYNFKRDGGRLCP